MSFAMERLANELKPVYREVTSVLARHDPIGLVELGCPEDEYSPEAARIARRTATAASPAELADLMHDVFIEFFDAELAGSPDRYVAAAAEVWAIAEAHGVK